MTLNMRKNLNTKLANGETLTSREVIDVFFLPEDADAFARQQGWDDADQMCYYEDMAAQEAAQQPVAPHELEGVDSREVYSDEGFDWAGVY